MPRNAMQDDNHNAHITYTAKNLMWLRYHRQY